MFLSRLGNSKDWRYEDHVPLPFDMFTETLATMMYTNRKTKEQLNNYIIRHVILWASLSPNKPLEAIVKDLGVSFRKSVSSLGHSFFPGNHSRQRGSKRFLSTYWNHTAHYSPMRWAACILSIDSYSPGRSSKCSCWDNHGKCIHTHVRCSSSDEIPCHWGRAYLWVSTGVYLKKTPQLLAWQMVSSIVGIVGGKLAQTWYHTVSLWDEVVPPTASSFSKNIGIFLSLFRSNSSLLLNFDYKWER